MSKEAMKLALEALDHNSLFTNLMPGYDGRIIEKAYKAINKALAEQPAQRKPLTDENLIECERLADICHRKHMGSIRGQQLSPADQFLWHYARAAIAKATGCQ